MDVNPGVAIVAFLLALVAVGLACPANAEQVSFHIPAGPAATTLRKFATQSNMNVLFQPSEVNRQKTHAVSGNLQPLEALHRMLAGTGLQYQFQEPDSVLVSPPESPNGGICEHTGVQLCGAPQSADRESASTVTVVAPPIDRSFEPVPVSIVTPYITLKRPDFETGGFQTVGEVLRSLPQNFGGGLNLGVLFVGSSQNITSVSAASTVNLRGLGSGSTLVLLNGQRLAASEGSGAVDITLIPLSAVERIEVTTGSASAIYGSDAVAGAVNIVIRTSFQGAELSSALGVAKEGDGVLRHQSVAAGHAIGDANVFAVADCAWQQDIDAQRRSYIPKDIAGTTLLPGMQNCSELFSATDSLPRDGEMSVLGAFTRRFADQAVGLTFPSGSTTGSTRADVDQYALNAILKQPFWHSWTATVSAGLSADDITSREWVAQTGIPGRYESDLYDNHLWTAQIVTSGTVTETRAGVAQLTLGAGFNKQDFLFASVPEQELNVAKRRRVRFAFAESAIPLIPSPAGARNPTALSLDLAIRREGYSDVRGATTSKIALTYKPSTGLKLQASRGTSFRAPTLLQQFNTSQSVLELVPDASEVGGQSLALLRFGGNSSLKPETSTDYALDLTLTPEVLPGASLQIGYFRIFYRDRIAYPTPDTTDPLSDPGIEPFLTRNPGSADISQILQQSQFTDLTGGQLAAQKATLVIDDRNQNIARQKASGVDVLWKLHRDTPFGKWDTSLNTAYLDLRQQIADDTQYARLSGTTFYPPKWRGRFGVSWSYGRYLASFFTNYTGGSQEVSSPGQLLAAPQQSIGSWTTLDGQIGAIFNHDAYWGSTKLTLSAQNILNRNPSIFRTGSLGVASVNYDSTNTSPVGRFLTLQLTQRW